MLTGQTDKTPRHGIFYFSDDGDLTALRQIRNGDVQASAYAGWQHRSGRLYQPT
jgi:hypothetical protein